MDKLSIRGIQKSIQLCSRNRRILNYLNQWDLSHPIRIFNTKPRPQSIYSGETSLTEMIFSRRENCYVNIDELNKSLLSSKIKYRVINWISRFFISQKRYKIFVYVDLPEFQVGFLRFQSTQIQLISSDRSQILHVLIPGCDKEWFVNDIRIRRKINDSVKSLIVPKLITYNLESSYFVSEYIDSKPLGHRNIAEESDYVLINNALVQYYQETSVIQTFACKPVFLELVEQLYSNLCLYDRNFAEDIKKRIIEFAGSNNLDQSIEMCEFAYTESVHGDINLRENIIQSSDGTIYFIDWELSRQSNVLYDLLYMLIQDSLKHEDVNSSPIAQFFQDNSMQDDLLKPFRENLGTELDKNELILYFLITIVDMLNTKVLILKKKRIPSFLSENMIKARWHGINRIIDFSENLFGIIANHQ